MEIQKMIVKIAIKHITESLEYQQITVNVNKLTMIMAI